MGDISHTYGSRDIYGAEILREEGSDRLIFRWWRKDEMKESDLLLPACVPKEMIEVFQRILAENEIQTERHWVDQRPYIYDRVQRGGGQPQTFDRRG